jgi:transcriptional regulator with XRE-family HTH domain
MAPATFRQWRKRLGYTQAEAAQAIGMGTRQCQKYEQGEAPIPLTVALACAAVAMGVPPLQ